MNVRRTLLGISVAASLLALPAAASADEGTSDEAILEFHFEPVPNLQIAIWLEDAEGNFIKDVYVTQATGKLGIGNRPGIWNFLSSWRFPYGPRTNVLPVWGHRRGVTYPKLVFADTKEAYQDSLGWHETTSSNEIFFCRPLTANENEQMIDVMSCPSPNTFRTDKGKYATDGSTSIYPPRNDLLEADPVKDAPEVAEYAATNDLDAVTGATPAGNEPVFEIGRLSADELPDGPIVAWIEVSLEHDENSNWDFDREDDHYVDRRLANYGIEWLGQPSVVYKVAIDPTAEGWSSTTEYFGYGDFEGDDGNVTPPDATISTEGGSGADRLRAFTPSGAQAMRFGVYTNGLGNGGGRPGGGDGQPTGCANGPLPALEDVSFEAVDFDRVRMDFTVPASLAEGIQLSQVNAYYHAGSEPLSSETLGSAILTEFDVCQDGQLTCDITIAPGQRGSLEITQLWGNFDYQLGLTYEDRCASESPVALGAVTTPNQEFQQIDTFCFVATAAWGGNWFNEVASLRSFRDMYLKRSVLGRTVVSTYYAYGPTYAGVIKQSPLLRGAVRTTLKPLADLARVATHGKLGS